MNLQEKYKNIFEAALLIEIEKNSTLISANEGDIILDVGKTIRVMPIVLSGIIKVSRLDENGHELLLYYINPNEGCAMTFTCCMQQQKSEIKAIVEESAQILAIPIAFMDEWMMKYPTWKSFVMKTIKTRFAELLKTIDQI